VRTGLGPGALLLTKAQYPIRFGNHDPCIGMGILWQPDDPVEVRIGNAIGTAIFIAIVVLFTWAFASPNLR
jgi:hypothetical protein